MLMTPTSSTINHAFVIDEGCANDRDDATEDATEGAATSDDSARALEAVSRNGGFADCCDARSWLVQTPVASALAVPHLAGHVVDLAGMIPPSDRSRIAQKLKDLEVSSGAQVVVLTVPSLERESVEEFTIRVVETWKLGRADQDDGVLLFVAKQERRLRLEVGYGLEGQLTDAMSRRILDNIVTPAFKQGNFGGGLEQAVDAIAALIGGSEAPAVLRRSEEEPVSMGYFFLFVLFFLFFVLPRFLRLFGPPSHRCGWSSRRGRVSPWIIGGGGSGGFGGGGFGGFSGGGGGFGGGGASGGW